MGTRALVSKIVGLLYFKVCDRYYHWYVHEDTGFRLSRKDLFIYSATFWVYCGSEEFCWIAKRGGADNQSLVIAVSDGLLVGSSIMFIFLTREIRKLKKKYEEANEREPACTSIETQSPTG